MYHNWIIVNNLIKIAEGKPKGKGIDKSIYHAINKLTVPLRERNANASDKDANAMRLKRVGLNFVHPIGL